MSRWVLFALFFAFLSQPACRQSQVVDSSEPSKVERRLVNLRAFSRLYGFAKYFHPSDEAAAADWSQIAVRGSVAVLDASDSDELAERLKEIFEPIAPSVRIGVNPKTHPAIKLRGSMNFKTVAWQHQGAGMDAEPFSFYRSVRVNHPRTLNDSSPGCINQELVVEEVAGKRARVTASLRTTEETSEIRLNLGSYTPGADNSYVHDLSEPLRLNRSWQKHSFERVFPAGARSADVGVCLFEAGDVEVREIRAEQRVDGQWRDIALDNPTFEDGLRGWQPADAAYAGSTSRDATGASTAILTRKSTIPPWGVFEGHASVGEEQLVELGDGLVARVPIAVWSTPKGTLPKPLRPSRLPNQSRGENQVLGLALGSTIITWNIFEHFFPYFDVIDVDWTAALDKALTGALLSKDPGDVAENLELLTESLRDGHIWFSHPDIRDRSASLPLALDWIENVLAVTASNHADIQVGDVVAEINGVGVEPWRADRHRHISGSSQLKNWRTLAFLIFGKPETVVLGVQRPEGIRQIEVTRKRKAPRVRERTEAPIRELTEGIMYVDLDRALWPEIKARLDDLASSPGVVFDLRGYPRNSHAILHHLLDKAENARWMFVPQITRPGDLGRRWKSLGWDLKPKLPRIAGTVVFLTDGRAASYAESVLAYVRHHRMGVIIGSQTAGVNGNNHYASLPGGFKMSWTGMKVLLHNGRQLHGLGIPPDIAASRTLEGLRAKRDEVLEVGIQFIRNQSNRPK